MFVFLFVIPQVATGCETSSQHPKLRSTTTIHHDVGCRYIFARFLRTTAPRSAREIHLWSVVVGSAALSLCASGAIVIIKLNGIPVADAPASRGEDRMFRGSVANWRCTLINIGIMSSPVMVQNHVQECAHSLETESCFNKEHAIHFRVSKFTSGRGKKPNFQIE